MAGLAGRRALVKITGAPVAFVDEATSTADDQEYTIVDAAKTFWDRDAPITVEVDGTPVELDPEQPLYDPYTVNRLLGTITFESADVGRGAVTVSGSYLPVAVAAGARSYAWSLEAASIDDTDFDSANTDSGFQRKLQGLKDVSGNIGRRWSVVGSMAELLIAGTPVILEFYSDRAEEPDLICWALLSKEGIASVVDGNTDGTVDWQGSPDADGNVAATPA